MKIAGLILAAGGSSRMGDQNKLLQLIDGTPMVKKVVASCLHSNLSSIYVVLGHDSEWINNCISTEGINFVNNEDWRLGMASSINSGIGAMNNDFDGAMILLGDMPYIETKLIDQMIELFQEYKIVVPVKNGRQGNPVLFSSTFFNDLQSIDGDKGAKRVIQENFSSVVPNHVMTNAIFRDIDTPQQMKDSVGTS
jgi:molybdenum cofactor cytidylyltransferase